MISDFIKGKKKFEFPSTIQKGIELHRYIDSFTDSHPATKEAKKVFQPHYRLYSGAFMDVVYDHFLATDKNEFTEDSLFQFSQQVYKILDEHLNWLPEKFAGLFPYMKKHNWLFNYRTITGIENSFGGIVHRATYINEHIIADKLFEDNYQLLKDCYRQFWKDVKPFAHERYISSLTTDNNNSI